MSKKLEDYVVTIPDFPEPGIMFRDITSVIQDPEGLKLAVDGLVGLLKDVDYDLIIGPTCAGRALFRCGKRESCPGRP